MSTTISTSANAPALTRRQFSAAAAALTACGLGAAAPTAAQAADGDASKELRCGSTAYFWATSMDPAYGWDGWEMQYFGITENLVQLDDEFGVQPWLATSLEQVDDLTWKAVLREGVLFHNGAPMDAAAVRACFERTYAENVRASETLPVDAIEADGMELTFTTPAPNPAFPNALCDPIFSVYYVGDEVDYAASTPCTGPYMVESYDPAGPTTVVVKNASYWGGEPKLDRISLKTFADNDAQNMALQSGELDVLSMPAATAYLLFTDESKYQKLAKTSTRADFLRFNMDHPLIANPAVREAIAWCIDRQGYADVICQGTEVPCWGVYSPQLPYGGTEGLQLTVDACDLDRAREVLDGAGIVDADGDGVRELDGQPVALTLYTCSAYERFVSLADVLQSNLAQVGVKLSVQVLDYWLEDAESFNNADPDITTDSYGMAPTGDPNYFVSMSFASNGSNNFGHYANAEVDALIAQLAETFDEEERIAVTRQIEQLVLDDGAYVFFANSQMSYIASTAVKDIAVAPSEYYFITKDTDLA